MRLLVFGGTAYLERKRIGAWSPRLNTEVLQDRSGLSERRPAFGVGIDNDAPYLIFRKIVPAGDRTYPITVLLEPSEDIWKQFQWNAALLIYSLFGDEGSVGYDLITRPESFYSEDSLERVFNKISVPDLLGACSLSEQTGRFLHDFWFGLITVESSIVLEGVEEYLEMRPLPEEMAVFLKQWIPESLRVGKGWLVGGNREHVLPFGAGFVFDGQKREAPQAEKQAIEKMLEIGQRIYRTYQSVEKRAGDNAQFAHLQDFFRNPYGLVNKGNGNSIKQNLNDLELIDYLFRQQSAEMGKIPSSCDPEREGRIVKRLEDGGSLFHFELRELMSGLTLHNPEANDARISFLAIINKDLQLRKNLSDATLLRIVEHSLKDKNPEEFPELILEEFSTVFGDKARISIETKVWQEFAEEMVGRTKGFNSFSRWYLVVDKFDSEKFSVLQQSIKEETRKISLGEVTASELTDKSKRHYLIYGEDRGGSILSENAPQHLNSIAGFLLAEGRKKTEYGHSAVKWLNELICTPAFIHIAEKSVIADFLKQNNKNGWKNYNLLIDALNGEVKGIGNAANGNRESKETTSGISQQEEINLLSELQSWKEKSAVRKAPPQLEIIRNIFSTDNQAQIAAVFLEFEPDADKREAFIDWLKGWASLAELNLSGAKAKLNSECLRLLEDLRTTNNPVKMLCESGISLSEIYLSFISDWAKLGVLLLGGKNFHPDDENEDKKRLNRFSHIFIDSNLDEPELYEQLIKLALSPENLFQEEFLRRIFIDEKVRMFLKEKLKPETKEFFNSHLENYKQELIVHYQKEIINLTKYPSHVQESFDKLVKKYRKEPFKEIFAQAAFNSVKSISENGNSLTLLEVIDKHLRSNNFNHSGLSKQIEEGLHKIADEFMFGDSDHNLREQFEKSLEEDKSAMSASIVNSVREFLREKDKEIVQRKGRNFFYRFINERQPERDSNEQVIYKFNSTLIDKIFECLSNEDSQQLLTALCVNQDIFEFEEFKKAAFFEFNKCEQIYLRINARNSDGIRVDLLDFSPFQIGYINFLYSLDNIRTSIKGSSEEQLLRLLQENLFRSKGKKRWGDLIKEINEWGIDKEDQKKNIEEESDDHHLTLDSNGVKNQSGIYVFLYSFFNTLIFNRLNSKKFVEAEKDERKQPYFSKENDEMPRWEKAKKKKRVAWRRSLLFRRDKRK